jgi:hypothetical protein
LRRRLVFIGVALVFDAKQVGVTVRANDQKCVVENVGGFGGEPLAAVAREAGPQS